MRIAYLVHDLSDPAVARRIEMLRVGGADVALAGFHRTAAAPDDVAGVRPVSLGRTHDARMVNRALMVAKARARIGTLAAALGPFDAIVARSLEMLALAERLHSERGGDCRLVYEVLDIHRLLLGGGAKAKVLRDLERRLARNVDLLLVSSPAFLTNYVEPLSGVRAPSRLVENKVLAHQMPTATGTPRSSGEPWRIGLFGALRDRQSIELLRNVAHKLGGKVEIVIRGRPSSAIFTDLSAEVAGWPHVTFAGPYRNPDDLATIYNDIHFVWAIDAYEADANSKWLLPNRIYEGGAFGAVPIGQSGTEIARFLTAHGIGVVLDGDLESELATFIDTLTPERARALADDARRVPAERFIASAQEARALVAAIAGHAIETERLAA